MALNDRDFSLPMATAGLLPHRPPMRLVDSLIAYAPEGQVVAATVAVGCPLVTADGRLEEVGLVELLAQAYAAVRGYEDLRLGRPVRKGFLVAIKSFRVSERARANERLLVHVRTTAAIDAFAVVFGEIFRDGETLAAGSIKLWIEPADGGMEK